MIVDPDFLDHWKTRILVGLLNDEAAPILVLRLWAHCQLRRQAVFPQLPAAAVKAICRFGGAAELLDEALIEAGFIRRDGAQIEVLGWAEYNSQLVAAWANGRRGGRPPANKEPTGIPTGKPMGSREEKSRSEKIRGDGTKESAPAAPTPLSEPRDGEGLSKPTAPEAKVPRPADPDPPPDRPPQLLTPVRQADPLVALGEPGTPLRAAVGLWIEHKAERRKPYKPAGLAALVSRAAKLAAQNGERRVIDSIEQAMAAGWEGWEHGLKEDHQRAGPGSPRNHALDKANINLQLAKEFLERQGARNGDSATSHGSDDCSLFSMEPHDGGRGSRSLLAGPG